MVKVRCSVCHHRAADFDCFLYLIFDNLLLPQDLKKVNSYLKSCFLIFPNYNLGHGLMEMAYNEYLNEYYAKIGIWFYHQAVTHRLI